MKIGTIILCAGNSSRMHTPKMHLLFANNQTFIEHLINVYKSINSKIYVVLSVENYKTIKSSHILNNDDVIPVFNHSPEKEKLYSLYLGLLRSNENFNFIQNIDNPFVSKNLLLQMIQSSDNNSYVKPIFQNKGGHPILLGKHLKDEFIYHYLSSKLDSLSYFLNKYQCIKIPVLDDKILANINTPEDYQKYFKMEKMKAN
ncbi:MAG TPA: NTP transferase domain-containing protein [Bacteroidia bacterium]|nr:NTP transferase domain-containing protein [Bacteroidia bacterium]